VAVNANALLEDLEQENEIVVYVDETYTTDQARGIRNELTAVPNVTSAVFVSREQATREFAAKYPDEALFQNMDPQLLQCRNYSCFIRLIPQRDSSFAYINRDMIGGYSLLFWLAWCPADPKLSGKVILVRSVIQRECPPVCRYYISSAIFHTF
jgi:hypothetical protein